MNPVFKVLSGIIIRINRMIDSLSLQTQETIRRSFFFLLFIFIIAGIVMGYNMGLDSAKIKSSPIAEYVNDTFKIDINREKSTGDFSGMLESEIMKESEMDSLQKFSFPSKEELNTDIDRNIFESENPLKKRKPGPMAVTEDGPVEESAVIIRKKINPVVRPLKKSSDSTKEDAIIINRDSDTKSEIPAQKNKAETKILQKDRSVKSDAIIKDSGIIDR